MSAPSPEQDIAHRALAEAAAWRVRLADVDGESAASTESFRAFEGWLASDAANAAAWERISSAWNRFDDLATAPELIALRQEALGDAQRAARKRWRPITKWGYGVAASLAVVIVAVWGLFAWISEPMQYRTALGERRVITLEDGSRIYLDSGSAVRVRYTDAARNLELERGQVRFDVAHNVERPFMVKARDRKIVATGTAFNIDLSGADVFITLIEGSVTVLDAAYAPLADQNIEIQAESVVLHPGEQLAALMARPVVVKKVNVARTTAWQDGQLVFEDEPLSAVTARVSRYSSTPVMVHDDAVGALRISGVFNTGDVLGFVDAVTHYLPVKAVRHKDGGIRLGMKR